MGEFIKIELIYGIPVTFVKMTHLKHLGNYVNAYVYIDKVNPKTDYQNKSPYATYQDGKVLGIDTAHAYNENQTYKQRYESAKNQIKTIIEYFYSGQELEKYEEA